MTPVQKAFKYWKKNTPNRLEVLRHYWGDDEFLDNLVKEVADKFGADVHELEFFIDESYQRELYRSLK